MSAVILVCMLSSTNAPAPAWVLAAIGFGMDCYLLHMILRG